MISEIENAIASNCPWDKLPQNIKKLLGNTKKEYEKQVIEYSIKTQLEYYGNLVQLIVSDQRVYYKDLVSHSRSHLMMFPYHLSEYVVRGLRLTPFQYYIDILSDIMTAEKSYDSLPNFTAADCLRLLGIGRNQYIELMNQCKSTKKLFRSKNVRQLLPGFPREIAIESWWNVKAGRITEEDIRNVTTKEKLFIDCLVDSGSTKAGAVDKEIIHLLYSKGLIYLQVSIEDHDCLSVPPLEGFVMNRVLGDYLENLMYKIFVSLDEHTTICELAKVLQIDLQLVKVAVSLFCRLGFAQRKSGSDQQYDVHPSWASEITFTESKLLSPTSEDILLLELESALAEGIIEGKSTPYGDVARTPADENISVLGSVPLSHSKRIAFLYDSTLTAFLMMGNLSPGLKSHAVTMFEVGKLLDESLDSLLLELNKIQRSDSEGEAQRYFEHALTLRTTINFLRNNSALTNPSNEKPPGLDLIRWESLSNLDPATTARLLNKNYQFLVSMAPLSYEIPAVEGEIPPHFGPSIPEVNSIWFKLFIYHLSGSGPPSLLLPKGERLNRLPSLFSNYEKVLVTPWGHDPTVIPLAAVLFAVNESLMHSPVLVQAYGWYHDVCVQHVPLPLEESSPWTGHKALEALSRDLDIDHTFGFFKFVAFPQISDRNNADLLGTSEIKTGVPKSFPSDIGMVTIPQVLSFDDVTNIDTCESSNCEREGSLPSLNQWMLLECHFGIPLFDASLNDEVSRRVVSHNLFSKESVEKFLQSSQKIVEKLRIFLVEHEAQLNPFREAEKRQINGNVSSLPLPTKPLLFYNGIIQTWQRT